MSNTYIAPLNKTETATTEQNNTYVVQTTQYESFLY